MPLQSKGTGHITELFMLSLRASWDYAEKQTVLN